jgi:hypothetical protein
MRFKYLMPLLLACISNATNAIDGPNFYYSKGPSAFSDTGGRFWEGQADKALANGNAKGAIKAYSFAGYGLDGSPTGVLGSRNVIIYESGGCYVARGFFKNIEGLEVRKFSGTMTPDYIYIWQMLCGDDSNIWAEYNYVNGTPSTSSGLPDWDSVGGIEISVDNDGNGVFEVDESYNYSWTSSINILDDAVMDAGGEHYTNDANEILAASNYSYVRSRYPNSLTVNGITFDDVVVDRYFDLNKIRYRAKGIGMVLELRGSAADPVYNSQSQRKLIFYRKSDGTTGGSAAGTPYAANATATPIRKLFTE